ADALQLAGVQVLLVDTADPHRSGLVSAARVEGPWWAGPHPAVRIRCSRRGAAVVARVETSLEVLTPGMVPPPAFWAPPHLRVGVTVVDVGHDAWRVGAHPVVGAGGWLRRGTPAPRPILVVRPSRPGLVHAEQVLARWETWARGGVATLPAQLVVVGARRWPEGVPGAAGYRVARLLDGAVFLPYDRHVAAAGVTAQVTPARLRAAVEPLLREWGLCPDGRTRRRHRSVGAR
ncbi:MAG: hypothetical protein ACRDQ5_22085, partial [Sciscionella sp.]